MRFRDDTWTRTVTLPPGAAGPPVVTVIRAGLDDPDVAVTVTPSAVAGAYQVSWTIPDTYYQVAPPGSGGISLDVELLATYAVDGVATRTILDSASLSVSESWGVRLDGSQELPDVPAPDSLGAALVGLLYEGYGDVDKLRDEGTIAKSLPGSGHPPIVFAVDDVDRPTFRRRIP